MYGEITAEVLEVVGLGALLEYMDMTKEELQGWMVESKMLTIEQLATFVDEFTGLCQSCRKAFVDCSLIDNEFDKLCEDCQEKCL